jgi:hypothetical protein
VYLSETLKRTFTENHRVLIEGTEFLIYLNFNPLQPLQPLSTKKKHFPLQK